MIRIYTNGNKLIDQLQKMSITATVTIAIKIFIILCFVFYAINLFFR